MSTTPNYEHVMTEFKNLVYEPEADTFLLMEALDFDFKNNQWNHLLEQQAPLKLLEVGCGSGVVLTHAAQLLSANAPKRHHLFYGTDINSAALAATRATWGRNLQAVGEGSLALFQQDLFPTEQSGAPFDIVFFNPPYVPTSHEECEDGQRQRDCLGAAWAGGLHGTEVLDRFIEELPRHLRTCGALCYLVVIRQNDPPAVMLRMQQRFPAAAVIKIALERFTGEYLSVLRLQS